MTLEHISYTLDDLSEYTESLPSGYIELLSNAGPMIPQPTFIRNWWHYKAVFEYGLSKIRIYRKGYLDKVMVSGINEAGERVHVFFQKTYTRGKYARKRKEPSYDLPPVPFYKDFVVKRVSKEIT